MHIVANLKNTDEKIIQIVIRSVPEMADIKLSFFSRHTHLFLHASILTYLKSQSIWYPVLPKNVTVYFLVFL